MKRLLILLALCLCASLLPEASFAQLVVDPTGAANTVGTTGGLPTILANENAGGVLTGIMRAFLPLANVVGVVILVITGLLLIITQDENQVGVAKKAIFAVVSSLVLINVSVPLALSFTTGFEDGEGAAAGASIISTEVLGFIEFIEVPLASIAVIMILINAIRAIATFGTDQGATHLRRTIISVVVGLILIVSKVALATAIGANPLDVFIVGGPDSSPLVNVAVNMLTIIISFLALAAVIVIIIAGITLVVNKGDQEVADKARGILIRVIIGLIIILISGGLTMIILG